MPWYFFSTSGRKDWDRLDCIDNDGDTLLISGSNIVFKETPKKYLENEQTIPRRIVLGTITRQEAPMTVHKIQLNTEVGAFPKGQPVSIELRISKDGGLNWRTQRPQTGISGHYGAPIVWRNIGVVNNLNLDLRVLGDCPGSLIDMFLEASYYDPV